MMQFFIININQFDDSVYRYHTIFKSFEDASKYARKFKKGMYKSLSVQKITASNDDIMFEILSESKTLVQRLIELSSTDHDGIHAGDSTIVESCPDFQLSLKI